MKIYILLISIDLLDNKRFTISIFSFLIAICNAVLLKEEKKIS